MKLKRFSYKNYYRLKLFYYIPFAFIFCLEAQNLISTAPQEYNIIYRKKVFFVDFRSIEKKISIIVPIFNKANYLKRSLHDLSSIFEPYVEFLLVDDNSNDSSIPIIISFMKIDNRFNLIHHKIKKGTAHARFAGIKFSRGQHILFIDPDDSIFSYNLNLIFHEALQSHAEVLVFRSFLINKSSINPNFLPCQNSMFNQKQIYRKISTAEEPPLALWYKIYKRSILIKAFQISHLFFSNKILTFAEDWLFNCFIYLFVNRYICTSIPFYIYYWYSETNSQSVSTHSELEKRTMLQYSKSVCSFLENYNISQLRSLTNLQKYFLHNSQNYFLYNQIYNFTKIEMPKNCFNIFYPFFLNNFHISNYKDFCLVSNFEKL